MTYQVHVCKSPAATAAEKIACGACAEETLIATRRERPTIATATPPAPPKLATIDAAADALRDMQELVSFVSHDDSSAAALAAERMLSSLTLVLRDYGLELAEVLPRKRCVDCAQDVADFRTIPNGTGPHVVVCVSCLADRAADAHAAKADVLELAAKAIAARAPVYGDAKPNFDRIARLWSALLGIRPLTAAEITLCMIAVKMSRLVETPSHIDSWVDTAGYADLGAKVAR